LNAVGNTASNKSTQLRVALKQATRFFCAVVFKRAWMARLNHACNNNRSSRPRQRMARHWQAPHFKYRFAQSLRFVLLAAAHAKYFL